MANKNDQTLGDLLQERAKCFPNKTCIRSVDLDLSLSYLNLYQQALIFSDELYQRNCRRGDKIVIGFSNTPMFFSVLFACFYNGYIAIPVDANLSKNELQAIIDHADPKMVICDNKNEKAFKGLRLNCIFYTIQSGLAKDIKPSDFKVSVFPSDAALMLYTSGTTGQPKGVMYSHEMVMARLSAIKSWFSFDESFTSLCLLPTHFGHGLICNCLSTFFYAGTLVIAPPFNLDLLGKLWGVIDQHRINTFSSVPTMIRLLIQYAQHRSEKIPDSLKFVTCASAPIASSEVALFEKIFKTPLLNCYGLTETCGWSTCSPNRADRSLSAVGMPINGEIRIIDDNGNALPPGEKGQLQIKGPSVMQGYFLNAELSNQILNDGWLSTGDIGEINERGEVFILSRIKDMIIRAGKNIYPAEVDQVLMSHPDVVEAYTVGLDDNLLGEKVAACVVLKKHASLNEVELIAFTQQMLADYKCPQKIIFLDSVPKTSRGKVNRSQLKVFFEVECL